MRPAAPTSPSPAVTRLLLALAAAALALALGAGAGWYRSAHRPVGLADLEPSQRQRLVAEMAAAAPGVFFPAWYEPRIGYTLVPDHKLEAWNDTFRSNRLGFRTGPPEKPPGVFRILFLGDSWAYGMNIRREESFPEVLAARRNAARGDGPRIESWTLALPGYNLLNEVAAFEFWEGTLAPDAVVVVPSSNDDDSLPLVTPTGQLFVGIAGGQDEFGAPHAVWTAFPGLYDGARALARWRASFARLRRLELHLERRGIPLALLFVARWQPPVVHRLVAEAGLVAPYAIVPARLTLGSWLTPPPNPHGNAAANAIYAAIADRLLAARLGWPALAAVEPEAAQAPLFARVPPRAAWEDAARALLREGARRSVRESFRAGTDSASAWAGPGDPVSGEIDRATTLLVRPPAGTAALEVRVRRIDGLAGLYPLDFEIEIPSAAGGTRLRASLPADGAAERAFRVPVPADRDGDQALEVVLVADRVAALPGAMIGKSLAVVAIRAAE